MNKINLFILVLFFLTLSVEAADSVLVDPMRPENLSKPKPKKVSGNVRKKISKPLILQQTVVSKTRTFAIINGYILSKGERVKGGYRVFKINDDNVILMRENKEFVLHLAGNKTIKELSR